MEKLKYPLIFCLALAVLWWFGRDQKKDSFSDFKNKKETSEIVEMKTQTKTKSKASYDKKSLLYKSRRPAQARREIDPVTKDFLERRNDKERVKRRVPEASEFDATENDFQSGYKFLKTRRAFKLSADIQRQYPQGFSHLGFWIAEDESFQANTSGLDVVYNADHETYGVVTGILKVELNDMRDESEFLRLTGGEVFERYEAISTILVKYQEKDTLLNAQKECGKDTRFKLCEIEILEHGRYAR